MNAPTPIRGDALLFYSMGISAFIESTTPEYVVNLRHIFGGDSDFMRWLEETWQNEEVGHGHLMREQLARYWPDFDFEAAHAQFRRRYVPRCDASLLRPSPALEALARCVTEAQAAASYRALASYGPDLETMFLGMAADEARHYAQFRRAFERHNATEKHGRLRRLQIVVERLLLVRDEDLPLGFAALNEHWRDSPPFVRQDYAGYLKRLAERMWPHFPFHAASRMLTQLVGPNGSGERWLGWVGLFRDQEVHA